MSRSEHRDILERLLPAGKGVWIPMDHGASSYPEVGLDNIEHIINEVINAGANAIVVQKGVMTEMKRKIPLFNNWICHISSSTVHGGARSQYKVSVASTNECKSRGAAAISVQVNLGSEFETEMIESLGKATTEAYDLDIPVLGMVYPRGPNLVEIQGDITGGVAHAARLAWELGCDVVKVPWTGSIESFKIVTNGVPIPVLIAGGALDGTSEETLTMVADSLSAGGAGVCMGRKVFASQNPAVFVKALNALIHQGKNLKSVINML